LPRASLVEESECVCYCIHTHTYTRTHTHNQHAGMSEDAESRMLSEGGTCDEYGFRIAEEYVDVYKKHSVAQAAKRQVKKKHEKILRGVC
jgi:hypothetical protein